MIRASQKEGEGDQCEMKAAQRLIESQEDLSNALITADALHAQDTMAREIVAALAMLRSCMIFFLAEDPHTSNINAFTDATAADSDKAMDMLMTEY